MKTFKTLVAQGDTLFRRINALPAGATPAVETDPGKVVVAHSETGHHHFFEAVPGITRYTSADPLVGYLTVDASCADGVALIHGRAHDTHESISFGPGTYEVRRQREYVPGGFRRVED